MNNFYFLPGNIPQRYERSDNVFSGSLQIISLVMQNLKNCSKGRALRSGYTARGQRAFLSVSLVVHEPAPNTCRCLTSMCEKKSFYNSN